MNPIEHPQTTRRMGAPRNWDQQRDGQCDVLPIADIVDAERHAVMESWWRPEPVELQALNNGSAVILHVFGVKHPVVSIGVTARAVGPHYPDPEATREGRSPLQLMEERIMSALDDLKAQVAETKSVEESAIALISGLAAKIRDAADDPDELEDLASQLEAETASLSAAVTANTPAPPASTTSDQAPAGDGATAPADPAASGDAVPSA